ncbi:MAG: hypothetical protein Q4C30_04010 [Bacteroidia bacterium]|nr:hypothetical protein [Bacteroidia bacterium]
MKYILINFINTLRCYKTSSFLNILGMAVAFAAFYIIMSQVQWGYTYNKGIEDGERIFLMSTPHFQRPDKRNIYMSRPICDRVLEAAPGVEAYGSATMATGINESSFYKKEGESVRRLSATIQKLTYGALSVFNFEGEQGDIEAVKMPNTVAVSSRFAEANNLKLGDYLSPSPDGEVAAREIVFIWKDKYPVNSSLSLMEIFYEEGDYCKDDWGEWSFSYFVKLKSADYKSALEEHAYNVVYDLLKEENSDPSLIETRAKSLQVSLIPFEDIYYTDIIEQKIAVSISGSKTTDITLFAVAILIVLIALINFVNFFFALVPARVKSVNTYKIFGTSREQLIANFILEAVGLVLLALLLGAIIVAVFSKSHISSVLSAPISLDNNMLVLWVTIGAALIGALIGAIYPAFYITSFQPALVLKGSFGSSRSGRTLRNVLIGVQFTISLALIISASFVRIQRDYMINKDMGFNEQYLITGYIPAPLCWYQHSNKAFEDRLRQNPNIIDITWADGEFVNALNRMGWGRPYQGEDINFQCYPVAYNFLDVLGVKVTEGRNFVEGDENCAHGVFIFNEKARDQFNMSLETRCLGHHTEHADIVGFCNNFNFRPLQYGIDPFAFYVFGQDHYWRPALSTIYVRINAGANPAQMMEYIRQTALEIAPNINPDNLWLSLFDEVLASKYDSEKKLSLQISLFTIIAIIISLMGVFGLVLFETQHRKREIAVRRVLGAEVADILTMLCRKYAKIVLVCFIVASPICYIVIDSYLSTFAYRTPIYWWVFIAALAAVMLITMLIVVARSWNTASSNPAEAVKTE